MVSFYAYPQYFYFLYMSSKIIRQSGLARQRMQQSACPLIWAGQFELNNESTQYVQLKIISHLSKYMFCCNLFNYEI